jgi:hypothetical protein
MNLSLRIGLAALFLMMFSVTSFSQVCPGNSVTMTISNPTLHASDVEFDVYVTNTSATNTMKLASVQGSITPSGMGAGTISATWLTQPSAADFPGHQNASAINLVTGNYRWTNNPPASVGVTELPIGQPKKFGRIRMASTVAFVPGSTITLTLTATSPLNNVGTFCNTNTNSAAHVTNPSGTQGQLTLGAPLVVPVPSACPTGALTAQTAVTCFGGNNASASITLTGTTPTSVSYAVDGGSSTAGTLASGVLTVGGLTAGAHSIVVSTQPGNCTLTAVNVTIAGPSGPLTNTTTQTACDSYVWGVTGSTYTASGTYTGTSINGNGCTVNETLVLTINQSTSSTDTQSACGSYTWAANGQNYTESGTYVVNGTNAAGCPDTKTLILTINQATSHTTTASACDTFTWSGPLGNGNTYTSSTTVSHVSTNAQGCAHTETLVLTINQSSTSSETVTACNSYTWAANNQVYTASGTYTATTTNASGCPNVATLILTINTASTAYYADTDGDGFGAGSAIFSCTGQPANTVLNNTDCAPSDPTKWRSINLYVDADNDGYYNGNPEATSVCYGATVPAGYTDSIIGTDCDDANPNANPNHVEIAGNSIDDNCDGATDEVGPAIGMIPSQCGTTMGNVAATIYSQQASGAQGYRFEVTNGSNVRTYDSATNSFSLLNLAGGVTYATTYTIRVAVKTNGFWRSYSSPCNITTPAQPATTNVIASQCGTTLANMANLIYCNQVTAANQYRFEVTDTNNTSNVRTFDTAVNRFSLTNLSGGGAYGATYSIRVALRFGSTWEPYGTACNISTPATPGVTSLIASQCGITISNRWVSLYANQVPDAQGYRFEVSDGVTTRFVDRAVSNFALGQVAGGVSANTVYTIRVAVLYNSVYGAFGSPCTVTTSGVFTRQAAAPVSVFEVKSYPNPFADTFRLDINTSAEESVSVKVYDMIGKLVESKETSVSGLGTQEIGSRYPSGVYNVIVSQGENVQTLRVIKR